MKACPRPGCGGEMQDHNITCTPCWDEERAAYSRATGDYWPTTGFAATPKGTYLPKPAAVAEPKCQRIGCAEPKLTGVPFCDGCNQDYLAHGGGWDDFKKVPKTKPVDQCERVGCEGTKREVGGRGYLAAICRPCGDDWLRSPLSGEDGFTKFKATPKALPRAADPTPLPASSDPPECSIGTEVPRSVVEKIAGTWAGTEGGKVEHCKPEWTGAHKLGADMIRIGSLPKGTAPRDLIREGADHWAFPYGGVIHVRRTAFVAAMRAVMSETKPEKTAAEQLRALLDEEGIGIPLTAIIRTEEGGRFLYEREADGGEDRWNVSERNRTEIARLVTALKKETTMDKTDADKTITARAIDFGAVVAYRLGAEELVEFFTPVIADAMAGEGKGAAHNRKRDAIAEGLRSPIGKAFVSGVMGYAAPLFAPAISALLGDQTDRINALADELKIQAGTRTGRAAINKLKAALAPRMGEAARILASLPDPKTLPEASNRCAVIDIEDAKAKAR